MIGGSWTKIVRGPVGEIRFVDVIELAKSPPLGPTGGAAAAGKGLGG